MSYACYLTASPFTLDSVHRTEDEADARITAAARETPAVTLSKTGDITLPSALKIGEWTWDSASTKFRPPDSTDDERIADMKEELYTAFLTYPIQRQSWWASISGSTTAMTALDRWVWAQVALGDLIADGNFPSTALSMANRADRVAHIAEVLRTLIRTWYFVMDGNDTLARSWSAGSVAAGAVIYSDIITAAGANRSADGSFTLLAGATIPTGFNPEFPTLRSP